MVARFLDATSKFVNFEFKRFNADGILEDELGLVQFNCLSLLLCEPLKFVVELLLLLDYGSEGRLRPEELSADLVVLLLEFGQL